MEGIALIRQFHKCITQFKYSPIFLSIIRTKTKSYCQHNYSNEVEAAVNRQIQAEQQAAQDYLNIAVVFFHPCVSQPGAGGYFMRMYEEEIGHMHDFIQYQLLRGGNPIITGLSAPTLNQSITMLDAFKQALSMEKGVTELLENLISVAESMEDYHCADYVTSIFLTEQIQSISEIAHHVSKLTRFDHNELAIYQYDMQLALSFPYIHKSKRTV